MAFATMWIYPWDLHDEGTDEVLSTLEGELGLDAVSLAVSYHSFTELRPHLPGPKFLSAPGALYFQPQEGLYRHTPIKPLVSPQVAEEDVLRRVSSYCSTHRLELVAWTVATHNSNLGSTYPEHCQQNAFGDRYIHALCPADSAVRSYILALCRDLTENHAPLALELEHLHYGHFAHYHGHAKVGVRLGPVEELLLSLCFCPACREIARRASVDVEALRREVRTHLETSFRTAEDEEEKTEALEEFLSEKAEFAAFLRAREEVVTSLHQQIKEELGCRVHSLPLGEREITGANLRDLAPYIDALELLAYTASPQAVRNAVENATAEGGLGAERMVVGLGAYYPATTTAQDLEANVKEAQRLGVWGYSFYNYGMMPYGMMPWVKRAVEIIHSRD